MILEIQAEITGNFTLSPDMEVKKQPYTLNIFQSSKDKKFYISVSPFSSKSVALQSVNSSSLAKRNLD